eukprot:gene3938-4193_t
MSESDLLQLRVRMSVMGVRTGKLLFTPALAPTVPAAADLALVLLRQQPLPNSAQVMPMAQGTVQMLCHIQNAAFHLSSVMLDTSYSWDHDTLAADTIILDILAVDGPLWELLVVYFALAVQAVHQQHQGVAGTITPAQHTAAASAGMHQGQQQQKVPEFHQQLLATLQVNEGVALPGLVQLLPATFTVLKSFIRAAGQPQQQQLPSANHSQKNVMCKLSFATLEMLSYLALTWPGSLMLFSPALAPAVPAATDLALALLRLGAASSRAEQGATIKDSLHPTSAQQTSAVQFAFIAVVSFSSWLQKKVTASSSGPSNSASDAALTVDSSMWQLMMAAFAIGVEARHREAKGLAPTPASQKAVPGGSRRRKAQQQVVPGYHKQLLQALGMADPYKRLLPAASEAQAHRADEQGDYEDLLSILGRMVVALCYAGFSKLSSSSSAPVGGIFQQYPLQLCQLLKYVLRKPHDEDSYTGMTLGLVVLTESIKSFGNYKFTGGVAELEPLMLALDVVTHDPRMLRQL